MALPSGINKQTGLQAALDELRLSPHNVVGVGDAENDHVFLSACECGVAVANALPSLKERADIVTKADHGAGVAELIDHLVRHDLKSFDGVLKRHLITVGTRANGEPVKVRPYRGSVLFAGPSGSGKSTAASALLESLADQKYQFCLIDPEGDYENFMGAMQFGTHQNAPELKQLLKALEDPKQNAVVNLLGIVLEERPLFFASLFAQIIDLRARTGRPHWIVVDEAHHMLSSTWATAAASILHSVEGMILITVHPGSIARPVLEHLEIAVAVGNEPQKTLSAVAKRLSVQIPAIPSEPLKPGEGMIWCRGNGEAPLVAKLCTPRMERRRHLRKYAQGELGPDRSFYFRGPENKLNLRAHNLQVFNTIAEGVDDETWLFHLRQGDYSRWFREKIKDPDLANEVQAIERAHDGDSQRSRQEIMKAVERYYTAAA